MFLKIVSPKTKIRLIACEDANQLQYFLKNNFSHLPIFSLKRRRRLDSKMNLMVENRENPSSVSESVS